MSTGAAGALVAGVRAGDRRAVAEALNLADDDRDGAAAARGDVLAACWQAPRPGAALVGITGPPGVGKSTLTARLIADYRRRGQSVGVLAVDPSSRQSGGALLGDRIRMQLDAGDDGIFVRSLATRAHLGGLAAAVWPAKTVLLAAYDRVLVESVGVGQTETEIADAVDLVLLVLQPASGDSIQFIKAGIMEIPDRVVLNKVDLRESGETLRELRAALNAAGGGRTAPELSTTSAAQGVGITELVDAVEADIAARGRAGTLAERRAAQWRAWLVAAVRDLYGRAGVAALGGEAAIAATVAANPFAALAALAGRLDRARERAS